jgi:hypothetical protein
MPYIRMESMVSVQKSSSRRDLVCPASKEIDNLETLDEDIGDIKVLPTIYSVLACTVALGFAVGLLSLLTVRFRQDTRSHDVLLEKLRRLVNSEHRNSGKGALS